MQACATKPAGNDARLMIAKIVMSLKFRGSYSFIATNSVYQLASEHCAFSTGAVFDISAGHGRRIEGRGDARMNFARRDFLGMAAGVSIWPVVAPRPALAQLAPSPASVRPPSATE